MKIYVLPYPVNDRMGMYGIVEKVKPLVAEHLKVGMVKIYSEDVAFQKALIEALQRHGYLVQGVRPRGDKRERLFLISHQIKDGTIQFAPRGNEELIMQIVNFGSEKFMDLVDALSMLVPEVVQTKQGYTPFSRIKNNPMDNKIEKGEEDDFPDLRPITVNLARELRQLHRLGRSGIF